MDKNSVIRNLLLMHCDKCDGHLFGCRGCTKEEEIRFIMSNLDEPKEEVIEIEEFIEEKPKKKKK